MVWRHWKKIYGLLKDVWALFFYHCMKLTVYHEVIHNIQDLYRNKWQQAIVTNQVHYKWILVKKKKIKKKWITDNSEKFKYS